MQILASDKQKKYIKFLYYKLGLYERCKDDYDRMTQRSAHATIKILNTELKKNERKWPAKSEKNSGSNKKNKTAESPIKPSERVKKKSKIVVRKKKNQ